MNDNFEDLVANLVVTTVVCVGCWLCGIVCGAKNTDRIWTQYVIENGAMEWHCDSKTGETVLRWKE